MCTCIYVYILYMYVNIYVCMCVCVCVCVCVCACMGVCVLTHVCLMCTHMYECTDKKKDKKEKIKMSVLCVHICTCVRCMHA
jgi:hypothetical protein